LQIFLDTHTMYASLGISAEQVYGDMYAAWLRDTHEKNTPDVKRLYTAMIDSGFGSQQVLLRRQRLGANFINSLVPLLHQSTLVKLDLHGNVLRDVGCELLVQVIRHIPCLTYLDIGANAVGTSTSSTTAASQAGGGVGGGGGKQLTTAAGAGAFVRSVGGGGGSTSRGGGAGGNARTCSRYLAAMQGLGTAIAQHKRLAVLILGSAKEEPYANHIEELGAVCVLEGCVLSRTLKRIDLSGNPFAVSCEVPVDVGSGGEGEGAAAAAAAAAAGSINNGQDGGAASGQGAAGGGGYDGIRPGPRTPVELLAQLFRTSTTLTHVRLRAVGLTDSGAAYLLDAAGASHSLLRLDMSENGFSSRVAEAAGLLLQQRTATIRSGGKGCALQSLALSDNDLRDNGVAAALARRGSFGFTMTTTTTGNPRNAIFSGNNDYNTAVGGGEGRFAATAPTLSSSRYVNRTRALRGGNSAAAAATSQPDPQAGLLLFSAISYDQFVSTLILDSCGLDDAALFALCRSLLTNAALTVLSLRNNGFSCDGVVQLGRALCRHPCLEKLFLSGNAVEDEGACALATALGYPEASLIELDLARTWLGDRGLIALGVALQTNTSLQVLRAADNHFTQEGGASFAALLENNHHVVRCEFSGTSVPHHVLLRLERATSRNRTKADNAESDALTKEVVRLHYQAYKLSEAQLELEALREKNADVKRTTENFDLQTKQAHNDFAKRIRDLGDQIESARQQEVRYGEQTAKLEADLAKAQETHKDDMTFASERLAAEVKMREEAEAEFHQTQLELEDWRQNGASREAKKRAQLAEMKADQEAWATQRKEYRERTAELQQTIAELEAAAAATAKPGSGGKKGK
jgi:Ran GTPase-activating protein (RanGAP) involved in mRNA processing and transport